MQLKPTNIATYTNANNTTTIVNPDNATTMAHYQTNDPNTTNEAGTSRIFCFASFEIRNINKSSK